MDDPYEILLLFVDEEICERLWMELFKELEEFEGWEIEGDGSKGIWTKDESIIFDMEGNCWDSILDGVGWILSESFGWIIFICMIIIILYGTYINIYRKGDKEKWKVKRLDK